MARGEYLAFDRDEENERGTTERWWVRSVRHGYVLGAIRWYGPWRAYVFFPEQETIWNADCLATIQDKIAGLMTARKAA